jgi:hypothetical protein
LNAHQEPVVIYVKKKHLKTSKASVSGVHINVQVANQIYALIALLVITHIMEFAVLMVARVAV